MKTFLSLLLLFSANCVEFDYINPESVDLGIEMQQQEASKWCWATVAQAIGAWRGEKVTQTDVVTLTFDRTCDPTTCNASHNPGRYLASIGLRFYGFLSSPQPSMLEIKTVIADGNPILVRYTHNSLAHIVLIGGYDPTGLWLYDPAFGTVRTVASLEDYRDGWSVAQVSWISE